MEPAKSRNQAATSPRSIVLMVLGGVLVSCLFTEAIAHLVPSLVPVGIQTVFQNEEDQPLKGLTPDEDTGYKYAPGLKDFRVPFDGDEQRQVYNISTVSLGYPDAGFRDDGVEGKPAAVVVGDSYVSCASVALEACWVERLERELHQDFVNLGVVGYGPQQEQRLLAKYGLPLKPERVVWVFFANDLNDAWRFDQFGSGAFRAGKFWQNPIRAWLARHSKVYAIGAFFWYNRYLFANLARADGQLIPRDTNLVWWLTYTDLTVPEVAEGLALTQAAILQAREETESQGGRFTLVILPFREQVYVAPALQPRLDRLNQVLLDFCQEHGIAAVDLTQAMRARAGQEPARLYYQKDIHLNVRGNEVVAELLAPYLKETNEK